VTLAASASALRILLADDHTVLRESLRRALEAAGHVVVGEAADGEEAVALAESVRPDCVVLDVSMPRLDGIGAARRISSMRTPVVILTMHSDAETRARALEAGAARVLTKDCSITDVVGALEAVVGVRARAADGPPGRRHDPTRLSGRETEILRLLASGASTIEVSERLYISAVTVKNHLASIYRKLGCRGRTEAVVYALKYGIGELTPSGN